MLFIKKKKSILYYKIKKCVGISCLQNAIYKIVNHIVRFKNA